MVVETQRGEAVILQARLAGRGAENIGVLLIDGEKDEARFRFRRDFNEVADETDAEVLAHLESDLEAKARELGASALLRWLEENASNFLSVSERENVLLDASAHALDSLYRRYVEATVLRFRTHLPRYSLKAAAGRFGAQQEVEPEEWEEAPPGLRLNEDMFVAHVVGHSMEPDIPDGSLCIFQANVAGTRQGKLVLVENFRESEQGARYTIKKYMRDFLERVEDEERSWKARKIHLRPLNSDYEEWELVELKDCRILAQFIRVL